MTSAFQIDRAARIVLAGGVIAYPTEAVFGLGCLPEAARAVERILVMKQRDPRKGLLLVAGSLDQVERVAVLPQGPMRERVESSWPGPVSWLLEARSSVPDWITGGSGRVGVRLSDHPVVRRLCERTGSAIVSTSANRGGRRPLTSPLALRRDFRTAVDYVLPGTLGDRSRPSTILDASDGTVVRAG